MVDESYIKTGTGGTSFVGLDAVDLYRAAMLKSMIGLHKKCGMIPTRGVTITRMFKMVSTYTGKAYKRGEHDRAMADLELWIVTMKAALPVIKQEG